MRPLIALLFFLAFVPFAFSVDPGEALGDAVLEARARAISADLRCLVCQNQSIDDSNSGLARDLRLIVRERLVRGDSDDEVVDYVVGRFGNYVLLKPPVQASTLLLWIGPALVLVSALSVFLHYMRRLESSRPVAASQLTQEEIQQIEEIRKRST